MMERMQQRFFPDILMQGDLEVLDRSFRMVTDFCKSAGAELCEDQIAQAVLRLYRLGITEPDKLAAVVIARCLKRETQNPADRGGVLENS